MNEENIEFYYSKPQSVKSRFIQFIVKISGLKHIMNHFSASKTLIDFSSTPYPIHSLKKVAHIRQELINGKNNFILTSKKSPSETVILYLHGGAFTVNFTRPHWNFIKDLIQQTRSRVVAPDFPLLPDYDYKARLEMVYQVYEKLLQTTGSKNIILMGDSSGGNMALALAQMLHENRKEAPAQIILLSPWLDVSMSNAELRTNLPEDPMLSYQSAIKVGKAHAGHSDTLFYQVSPLYGTLRDIGKISLFTGTHDILYPDACKLKKIAREQQVPLNYFEYKAMMHAWMLFDMPEARLVKQQIASLIR
jgi:acetyl esterase/lipase